MASLESYLDCMRYFHKAAGINGVAQIVRDVGAKAILPLILWYWRCPYRGRGRCNSTVAGLHRERAARTDVRIIDFVDAGHAAQLRMWDRRQRGFRAMGYSIRADASPEGAVEAELPLHQALLTRVQR